MGNPDEDDHSPIGLPVCATNTWIRADTPKVDGRGKPLQERGQYDSRDQSAGSCFIPGDVVERRSLLDGGAGDDAVLSESDGSPESGLGRF